MTQTTPAPVPASPAPNSTVAPQASAFGVPPAADPYASPTNPASAYPGSAYPGSAYPGSPYAGSAYPGSPQPGPAPQQAPRRGGPGWVALIAAAGGSALLASLLAAGAVTAIDHNSASATTSTSQSITPQRSGPVASSTATNPDWPKVASAVEPSVVSVKVTTAQGGGEGSGVILDKAGHILTNNHVVSGAQSVTVVLNDGRGYKATVVGTDPSTDIAVIKVTTPPKDLTPATLGDSSAVGVGDPVMAVGNPLGLSDTVTTGIVSAVDRPVTTSASEQQDPTATSAGEQVVSNAIQTDAAVNPGNSGGALVDSQGRVVGINSAIASLGSGSGGQSGSIGLGFAIPVNEAKSVADQLMTTGKVQHAYMGVSLQQNQVAVDGALRQAAVVGQVSPNSPAAKAGLKTNDAIIAIQGKSINGADSLVAQVRALRPGTQVTLTVVRNGAAQDIPITLGVRPAN